MAARTVTRVAEYEPPTEAEVDAEAATMLAELDSEILAGLDRRLAFEAYADARDA